MGSTRFVTNFDGSGRNPRKVQKDFLTWLSNGWDSADVHCGQLPVGSGKSAIARAIQLETGAAVIPPSNLLINQYIEEYPGTNFLKGKVHYSCRSGLSCADWQDVLEQKACLDCPYALAKKRAETEPTFFNAMSLFYWNLRAPSKPRVIVVDEAHQLTSMLLLLTSKRFRRGQYRFDDRCRNEIYLAQWMRQQLANLNKLANLYHNTGNFKKVNEIAGEIESISMCLAGLESDPQNYAIWESKESFRGKPESFLNVKPVRPPAFVVRNLLDCAKLVLLSGTLFKSDIEDLSAGRSSRFIDLPSPIPKENRPIYYRPVSFPVNYKTDPAKMVGAIDDILTDHPGSNSLVHTTYDRSKKMAPHFRRPVLTNTPETKNAQLDFFKKHGGVFFAAGCAEGLDLKDDLCRVNIIPFLITPNMEDPVVKKRMAQEDGQKWLALETLKSCIQQAGRSTRHERDHSKTYILDPRFASLVNRNREDLPQSFLEALIWNN